MFLLNAGVVRVIFREKYRSDDGLQRLKTAGVWVLWSPSPEVFRVPAV